MAERFNRASLLQNAVTPVSGGNISVPLKDPANAEQANMFGNLSQRLDSFTSEAFKIAGAKAKAAGSIYGARQAPTFEQVEQANKAGLPVDLPGDVSSLNIFEQSAYASSLSMLEDSTEIAGRKAMTIAMAEASTDPDMDPATFTSKLDSIVSEYSQVLGAVSPSAAGKVNAGLGILANSQVVSFSREYMGKAMKKLRGEALEHVNVITNDAKKIIFGYDASGEVSLLDNIAGQRLRIRNILEKAPNVDETKIIRAETLFDKTIKNARKAVVLDWARTSTAFSDNPTGAARALQHLDQGKETKIPKHIKDIWKTTKDVGVRNEVFSALSSQANQMNQLDAVETARASAERAKEVTRLTRNFYKAQADGFKIDDMNASINDLNDLGEDTKELKAIVDAGKSSLEESNSEDVLRLTTAKGLGNLTISMINNSRLTTDDQAKFIDDLEKQRDKNVKEVLVAIKGHSIFHGMPDETSTNTSLDTKQKAIRQRFFTAKDKVDAEKIKFEKQMRNYIQNGIAPPPDFYFDANVVADRVVKDIKIDMQEVELNREETKVEKGYVVLRSLPGNYPETQAGLRQALMSTTTFRVGPLDLGTSRRYQLNDAGKYFADGLKISEAIKSLDRIDAINDAIRELGQ